MGGGLKHAGVVAGDLAAAAAADAPVAVAAAAAVVLLLCLLAASTKASLCGRLNALASKRPLCPARHACARVSVCVCE